MKHFILGVIAAVLTTIAAGAALIYSGAVNVAADDPHLPLVLTVLNTARERAVEESAKHVAVPPDIGDSERLRRGAGNYAAMCADCHLRPGETDSELRRGLYPHPPALTEAEGEDDEADDADTSIAARRFWVVKHGIKSTGMAAWGRAGLSDENIWDLVAFVHALPAMGPAEYRAWVAASDGHVHGTAAGHDEGHHMHDHGDSPGEAGHDHGEGAGGHSHADGALESEHEHAH